MNTYIQDPNATKEYGPMQSIVRKRAWQQRRKVRSQLFGSSMEIDNQTAK